MTIGGNPFAARLETDGAAYRYFPVASIEGSEALPYALKVLLENVLRKAEDPESTRELARRIVEAGLAGTVGDEVEFSPARVLFQDFTGVPVFVDFAVMREACVALGGDPKKINPQIPCDLVIDHSVIADERGMRRRPRGEHGIGVRTQPRTLRLSEVGSGVVRERAHRAAGSGHLPSAATSSTSRAWSCVRLKTRRRPTTSFQPVYFDTLVGSDSHTPTANGIGVLGWGVGGIEAEAAALGQPITTLVPRVVGVRLTGALQPGVTAMDVALAFAQTLRAKGVVGCFVECFGEGLASLTATQRTCISNMTPEYGCTCTLFPVDGRTLEYLRLTGKDAEQVALVEAYAKAQGFWHDLDAPERTYADVVELDLSTVTRSIAGPSRPHDRIGLCEAQERFHAVCAERGLDLTREVHVQVDETGVRAHARGLGHRGGDQLHDCDGSVHDGCGWFGGTQRGGARAASPPLGEDHPRAGQPCHGAAVGAGGAHGRSAPAGIPYVRFRLHELHRQFRARAGHPASGGERHRTGERPFRQPQLRRPHFARRGAELPGCAGRGGGLCAGRHHGRGPGARRAWPRRTGPAGAPGRHLALRRARWPRW